MAKQFMKTLFKICDDMKLLECKRWEALKEKLLVLNQHHLALFGTKDQCEEDILKKVTHLLVTKPRSK
jgi:hypothetical protein